MPSKTDDRFRTVVLHHLRRCFVDAVPPHLAPDLYAEHTRYFYPRACALILRIILFIVGCRERSGGGLIPRFTEQGVLAASLPMLPHRRLLSLGNQFPHKQRPSVLPFISADRRVRGISSDIRLSCSDANSQDIRQYRGIGITPTAQDDSTAQDCGGFLKDKEQHILRESDHFPCKSFLVRNMPINGLQRMRRLPRPPRKHVMLPWRLDRASVESRSQHQRVFVDLALTTKHRNPPLHGPSLVNRNPDHPDCDVLST